MTIAEQVTADQDPKEMTRRAIKILEALGLDASDLKEEFLAKYKEPA